MCSVHIVAQTHTFLHTHRAPSHGSIKGSKGDYGEDILRRSKWERFECKRNYAFMMMMLREILREREREGRKRKRERKSLREGETERM